MGSVFGHMPVAGTVPNYTDIYDISNKLTYDLTCSVTFDISSFYFDDNGFLQYLQGNDVLFINI